ncbi:PIN domain-containing protein [Roseofilum sp. Guam]|uniref:PIN domain-containing protein n=1 Tax=Roseofilum sp. Guam TaxID=2821502 RepID=UPI00298D9F4E|nr:PIN domain-containing protein [Roseofilum sp. Guam]
MVKVLFDTSILVSAFVVSHPHHQSCADWLDQAKVGEIDGFVATHTLAETYSVLTRLPLRPRISAHLAQQLITENKFREIRNSSSRSERLSCGDDQHGESKSDWRFYL